MDKNASSLLSDLAKGGLLERDREGESRTSMYRYTGLSEKGEEALEDLEAAFAEDW